MKIALRFCIAAAALVGASVAAAAQETLKDAPYYPVKLGTTWEYRGGARPLIMTVARYEAVGSHTCAALEWSMDSKLVALEHVFVAADGVYRCAYSKSEIVPPFCFLKLPPVDGDSWSVNSTIQGTSMVGTFVLHREKVTVPVGQFDDAFASASKDLLIKGQGGLATTYWFAPGYGLIKQFLNPQGQETTFELVKFTHPLVDQLGREPDLLTPGK